MFECACYPTGNRYSFPLQGKLTLPVHLVFEGDQKMLAILCQNTGGMRVILAAANATEKSDNSVLGTIVIIGLAVFLFFKWKKNQSINNSKNNGTGSSGQPSYGTQQVNTPTQTQQPQQNIFNRPVGQFFKTPATNSKQTTATNVTPKSYSVNSNSIVPASQSAGSVILVILIVQIVLCFLPTTKFTQKVLVMDDVWSTSNTSTVSFIDSIKDTNWSAYSKSSSSEKSEAWGVLAPYIVLIGLPVILLVINWKMREQDKKLILMIIGGITGIAMCFYGSSHTAKVMRQYLSRGKLEGGLTFWGYIVVIGYVALIAYSYVTRKNLKS